MRFTQATANALHAPNTYVRAILSAQPVAKPIAKP
jgi:multicomponent K+:H+ antiporter subunit D